MNRAYDAIVVGAGILGASTAYHLKRNEVKRVALFERRGPASGGTGKSAAIVRQGSVRGNRLEAVGRVS